MVDSGDAPAVSWRQVHRFRLNRHHLLRRAPRADLVAVVSDLCCVQTQLSSAAELALWARVRGLTSEDVESALWRERSLVKTWCMRGTTHLLPAAEFPMYVAALRESAVARDRNWIARYGITEREMDAMADAVVDALASGPLARRELADRVVGLVGPKARRWVEHSWGGIVRRPCFQGRVCFGAPQGREVTFVRTDQWVAHKANLSPEDARTEMLRHYLRAYGPATSQDFLAWSGMAAKDVRSSWDSTSGIAEVAVEGQRAWMLREDLTQLSRKEGRESVRLLPSFDTYLLGHRDKGHLVDAAHYKRVYRKAGWLSPVVLVDGRVAGVWTHRKIRGGWDVRIEPFRPLTRLEREGIAAEVEDLGRFLGGTAEVRYAR